MTTTNLVLKEYMPVVDYFRQQRRTIELITELDQKVAEKQTEMSRMQIKYLEFHKDTESNSKIFKLLKMQRKIDYLFRFIMSLSDMKIELVRKLDEDCSMFVLQTEDLIQSVEESLNAEEEKKKLQCICQGKQIGQMIKCENSECKIGWFHLRCLNFKKFPTEIWFCSQQCYDKFYNVSTHSTNDG